MTDHVHLKGSEVYGNAFKLGITINLAFIVTELFFGFRSGTIDPSLEVPAQVVRLRVLNGPTNRIYYFGFQNNHPLYQIGSDGGLLESPVNLTRLVLVPGERAKLLVKVK